MLAMREKSEGEASAPMLMYFPELVQIIGRSRPTVAEMLRRGELPRPVLNGRNKAWPRAAILTFLGLGGEQYVGAGK
jgi:predicted DNA-binding transcriptional regulator AlpA